jgi:endonuclease YncB( thermonuclease family)
MRWLPLVLLLLPSTTFAESWFGTAHVVDGDTIYVDQTRLRLLSIDAFESAQTCTRDGRSYGCGEEATRALIRLIGQRPVRCEGNQRDRYKRPLVKCWIGNLDLGRAMIDSGWAVAEFGDEYQADEKRARAARAGAWAGMFERPKDWRRGHPRN